MHLAVLEKYPINHYIKANISIQSSIILMYLYGKPTYRKKTSGKCSSTEKSTST